MDENQLYTIILRHDTSTQWMIVNPVLALGEYGVEDDTHRIKRGDGIHTWSELTYDHFGFEYAITFANLQGNIEDNEQLSEAFNETVKKKDFVGEDGKILLDINIEHEDQVIAKLSKVTKNMETNETEDEVLVQIVSDDDSINGLWTTNEQGVSVLNLESVTTIKEYSTEKYYKQYQVCIYDNVLYMALKDLEPGEFNEEDWRSITSSTAEDIEFDTTGTELSSTTVQGAISELDAKVENVIQKQEEYELQII